MAKPGKCVYCGEEFGNLPGHLRFCKSRKEAEEQITETMEAPDLGTVPDIEEPTESPQEEITAPEVQTPEEPQEIPREAEFKPIEEETEEQEKPPLKMDIPLSKFHEPEGDTEEEKIKNFFGNLPKWTAKRPTGIRGKIFNLINGGKALKPCVFVSEHEPPKICYVPWDPKREVMFHPTTGEIYEPPTKGDIAFFHRDKFRPLINSRDPNDIYDLPEHYALKLYNMGLQEAQLKGFDDLISMVKKTQFIAYATIGLSIIILIGAVAMIKFNSDALTIATQEMSNVTRMYGGI